METRWTHQYWAKNTEQWFNHQHYREALDSYPSIYWPRGGHTHIRELQSITDTHYVFSMPVIQNWTKYNFRRMAGRQALECFKLQPDSIRFNKTEHTEGQNPTWIPFAIATVIAATNTESPPTITVKQITGKHYLVHDTQQRAKCCSGLLACSAYHFSEQDSVFLKLQKHGKCAFFHSTGWSYDHIWN